MRVGLPRRRLTFRWRLTLAFGAIAFGAGAFVIALLYLFMRYVPTYLITPLISTRLEGGPGAVPAVPSGPASTGSAPDDVPAGLIITNVASILDTLLWAGVAILLLLSALAGWAGWIVAGRMLKPLAQIGEAAHRAGEGALDSRIALDGPRDEIRDLADTFDHTLDRLQRAFTAHERFAANAAHELRTPLTATKTLLDVARAHPGAIDPVSLADQVRRNNDRSIALVQALLALTSIEAGPRPTTVVDLAVLARDAASQMLGEDDGSGVVRDLAPAPVEAEPVLAMLLVENLIRNALQHNDARRLVHITTGSEGGVCALRVENTGPLVPPDEVAKLTEPLYRSRRAAEGGHGLGLAMARSIAEVHGAELRLEPRVGGGLIVAARFRLAGSAGSAGFAGFAGSAG